MNVLTRFLIGLCWALAIALMSGPTAHAAAVVTTDQVRAELLVHAPGGLRPGEPAWLGLKIVHKKGWHTYWLNPGDSGLPTQLQWQLPAGLQAGDIEWPVPSRLPIGPLMNHGYEGTLLLPVPLTVTQPLPDTPLTIRLRADWLVCEDVCIPEGGDFSLTLPAGTARSALAREAALFEQAQARQPVTWPGAVASARVDGQGLQLTLKGLPPAWQGKRLAVFPMDPHVLSPSVEPQAHWGSAEWQGLMAYSPQRMEAPAEMGFVVALAEGGKGSPPPTGTVDAPAGIVLKAAVGGTWPTADAGAPAGSGVPDGAAGALGGAGRPLSINSEGASGWWAAAALALLGGLILNLMPCVFPVLSLKVFGFAADAHNRRALALGGVAYTVGVVVSFTALAALLLALRSSGEQLGWGFQLQSPLFVAALAALFTLIGLNLAGVFEFGSVLPGSLAALRARHPVADSALTGVLAVAVASPCTAPFMGASLGLAVGLPAWQALPVFAAMGLGMALPYLAVSLWPALAHRLPRPGAWMQTLRQALAFPMLATVVWLLWVLGLQTGMDVVALLLAGLLTLALLLWALQQTGRTRLSMAALAMVLLAALVWQGRGLKPDASAPVSSAGRPGENSNSTRWQVWSPTQLDAALTAGKPVFVDFTAAWCVTCQYNKKTVLADDQVLAAFDRHGVVTLRADWTRRDEAITRALNALGRSGVPVYALYRPGQPPRVLSELPSVREVVDALSVER